MSFGSVTLTHETGVASCEVNLLGATITSWKLFNNEMLYLSPKSLFDGSKPIRGGIPLVFPQFGPGKLQQHGFARNVAWEHVSSSHDSESGAETGVFKLVQNEYTMAMWPHEFELYYSVSVGLSNMTTELKVVNTGKEAFEFQTLLHTYFRTDDLLKTSVNGLVELDYINSASNNTLTTERAYNVNFNGEYVDRIYKRNAIDKDTGLNRADGLVSVGDGGNCDLVVRSVNMTDMVVWNPGMEKCKAMSDMPDDGFLHFVCMEVGMVTKPAVLEPGQQWNGGQSIVLRVLSSVSAESRRKAAEEALKQCPPKEAVKKILPAKSKMTLEAVKPAVEESKIEIIEDEQ